MEKRKGEGAARLRAGELSAARPIFHFGFCIFLAAAAFAGCAAPSEPTARHAPVPAAITDLTAVQQGRHVNLKFTLPKKTADGKPLPADPSIEIYRQVIPAGAKTATMPVMGPRDLAATIPSPMVSHYTDGEQFQFPFEQAVASVAEASGERTVFLVRTRVSVKKSSADSNSASLHLYEPIPPATISATITHDAIILSGWGIAGAPQETPSAGNAATDELPSDIRYRVYREEMNPNSSEARPETANETQLARHLEQIAELPADARTYEDTNFRFDHSYVYAVRSVAKHGTDWVESDDSNLLTVTPKDTFPPAAPQGVVVVYVPASADTPAHLELSWSISPETDLAGYDVYRKGQDDATALKLNSRPLPTPAYRDMNVQPGRSYSYLVRAVDRAGNESPASEPASADVPATGQNGNQQP